MPGSARRRSGRPAGGSRAPKRGPSSSTRHLPRRKVMAPRTYGGYKRQRRRRERWAGRYARGGTRRKEREPNRGAAVLVFSLFGGALLFVGAASAWFCW